MRRIFERAAHLPHGRDFITYGTNRVSFTFAQKTRKLRLPHPTSLMLEVTNVCQLKCVTCPREYSMGNEMDTGHMDLETVRHVIDENHVYLDSIGLSGLGETLLYPYLADVINHIRSRNKGLFIFISTNAQQANAPQILDSVADKVNTLQISIDGCGKVFEDIRGGSDWDKFLKNLHAITRVTRGRRARLKFNMVVQKQNYLQMVDVVRLAVKLGIPEIYFNTFNLVANDLDVSYYHLYQTDEFHAALNEALAEARREGVIVGYQDIAAGGSFRDCPYPWNHFYITWDGFIVPCCAKPFPKVMNFGNVREKGLMHCINSDEFMAFRDLSNKGLTPAFCKRCHMVS